ncbi:MAG: hypothetical protein J5930_03225 [Treponema sp.]|nr:hypothetical protein [Treponema sp.]
MKRIIAICIMFAAGLSCLSAEMNPRKRYIEMQWGFDVYAGQNAMNLTDIFQKELVLDFPQIYRNIGNGPLSIDVGLNTTAYDFSAVFGGWGAGIRAGISGYGTFSVSNDMVQLLAEGNTLDEEQTTSFSLSSGVFINCDIPFYFKVGKLRFVATPSAFVPMLYIPASNVTVKYTMHSDGSMDLVGSTTANVYSLAAQNFSMQDTTKSVSEMTFDAEKIFQSLGVDLSLAVEYPLFKNLDLGGYATVPIIPGRLNKRLSGGTIVSIHADPVLGTALNGSNPFTVTGPDTKPWIVEDAETFYVNRPMRLGAEVAWRPFGGNWFVLHGRVGGAMRNPFGKDFTWNLNYIYPEYKFALQLTGLYVFGFDISTEYTDRVFTHSAGIRLNIRVLELDATVGISSPSFLSSFTPDGVKASISMKMGF